MSNPTQVWRFIVWGFVVWLLSVTTALLLSDAWRSALEGNDAWRAARRPTGPPVAPVAQAMERAFQSVAERAMPAVVQVLGDREFQARGNDESAPGGVPGFEHFFSGKGTPRVTGTGSGFFVGPAGAIVTNAHVVQGTTRIRVKLHDGEVLDARLLGVDAKADLAVLQVPPRGLAPLAWADSSTVKPGAIVLALGSPFGLQNSVTQGIVSAVSRHRAHRSEAVFIQTDAAINAGNSGGPLVNLAGQVVGVNTAIFTTNGRSQGVGLAIPSSLARVKVRQLLGQRPGRGGWLGIVPAAGADGVRVAGVIPGSPIDLLERDVRTGDRIATLNGQAATSVAQVRALLRTLQSGQTIEVAFRRGEAQFRLRVALGTKPQAFRLPAARKEPKASSSPRDLSDARRAALRSVLNKRDCPCPCGRTLMNCFGCSAAKSEFTDATRFASRGLAASAIDILLDPPALALAWFDYSDPDGRKLMRILAGLKAEFGDLLRVRPRYYPARAGSKEWLAYAAATELARARGQYDAAHRLLVQDHGTWAQALKRLVQETGLTEKEIREAVQKNRFAAQMRKDLAAAPTQYGVKRSPTLIISGEHYNGPIGREAIAREIQKAILGRSL